MPCYRFSLQTSEYLLSSLVLTRKDSVLKIFQGSKEDEETPRWPQCWGMPQAKAVVGGQCDLMPGYYLKLAQKHQPSCRTGPQAQGLFGRGQMLCLAPRAQLTASHRQGAMSFGWRWTQVKKSVGWQVWQTCTLTAIPTGNEETIKPNTAGLWDRMNHPTSNHRQTQGASFSPPFSFLPTLSSYLMPILMLIKPAFPRSWFNSLTWQESDLVIKRLNRFLLAFGAFESRKEGLGST